MKHIAIILALTTAALAQQPESKPAPKPVPTLTMKVGAGGLFLGRNNTPDPDWMAFRRLEAIQKRCPNAVQITNSPDKADYSLSVRVGGLVHIASGLLFDKEGKMVHEFKDASAKAVCQYFEENKKKE
jgi:hypothetical protein